MINDFNKNNSILIKNFIQTVKKYYPIDLPIPNKDYEGYYILIKTIENKIEQIMSHDLPSNVYSLFNEMSNIFKGLEIIDECHKQFPNYSFTIQLSDQKFNHICSNSTLLIKVSLLTNYFTVFYEEINIFENFSKFKYKNQPLVYRIYTSKNKTADPDKIHFNKAIRLIQKYFPSYNFVEHSILFNTKISRGIPYNQEVSERSSPFPIYDFLFDNEYLWGTLEVAF